MHIQYRPDTHRTTFESLDPLDKQWDYLEGIGQSATHNFSPISSEGSYDAATAATTGSIPLDTRKREYILYSRKLVRHHINLTYLRLNKKPPGTEKLLGPQLVSALIRAGKELDQVAKGMKMKTRSAVSLWHAMQYALRGEFITLEQATIRGCGPDGISAVPSGASSPSDADPSPHPSVKDKGKKKANATKMRKEDAPAGKTANLTRVGLVENLNTFSAKLLRLGSGESAIRVCFEELCEPQNKGKATSTPITLITPRCTTPSAVPVSSGAPHAPPTSCHKSDTGTLPRALHSPENEFMLLIPPLPLPNFVPKGGPVNPRRKKRGRKGESSDQEANRRFRHEMCSPLLRTRRMLSCERRRDKALTLAQASRSIPPGPTLEFKSYSELDASGISGVLRPPRVYPGRANDWSQRHLEEQRNELAAPLETKTEILGRKAHRVPLPGSASPTKIRHCDPELPNELVGKTKPSRLRPITFSDQRSGTTFIKQEIIQGSLIQLPKGGVESGIAYLKNFMAKFSRSQRVPFSDQLLTPTPTKHKVERKVLALLPQEATNARSIPTQTPPSSSKRRLSPVADAAEMENQGSQVPEKWLEGKLKGPGGGKFDKIRQKANQQTPDKEGRPRKRQRKRSEESIRVTGKATPPIAQTPPSRSKTKKPSPVTGINHLRDLEWPLMQKKRKAEQKKSHDGGIGEPIRGNSEDPGGMLGSLGGVERASRPNTSNDTGGTLLVRGMGTMGRQAQRRVRLGGKRAIVEDPSKHREDCSPPIKRARTTGPLEPSTPLPTTRCVIS